MNTARTVAAWRTALTQARAFKLRWQTGDLGPWDSTLPAAIYALKQQCPALNFDESALPDNLRQLLTLAGRKSTVQTTPKPRRLPFLDRIGDQVLRVSASTERGLDFLCQALASLHRLIRRQAVMRPTDLWSALEDCGPRAVGIVSLISLLVGLILAFVGAIQLKSFGAQIYVASLVTIGMTRIMGAIMIGVIMAGRTGASFAAAIGTMQVNEELDALKTMGISRTDFLVLPRLLAMMLVMPLLVILADFAGMLGGGLVGVVMLGLAPEEYWKYSVAAFNLTNFWVGVFHGFVFGIIIALCGCYFGMHCGRDSGSVGIATTRAVVYGIVWMIVMTGVITLICEGLGI